MRGKKLSDASFLQVSFPKGWKIVVAAVHLEAIGAIYGAMRKICYSNAIGDAPSDYLIYGLSAAAVIHRCLALV